MIRHIKFEDSNFTFENKRNSENKSFFNKLLGIAFTILPEANPDFANFYKDVKYWLIEFEEDTSPSREIGFNGSNEIIAIGPLRNNRGFWTDSNLKYNDIEKCFFKSSEISENQFQKAWDIFTAN